MSFTIKRATKAQSKLRAAFFGPSGAGKTYSMLRIATGLAGEGGKIGFIDTERGTASKYSDRFTFDVIDLEKKDFTIEGYCAAMEAMGKAGYGVLCVDSMSHSWQQLCEEVEKLAQAKYRGNTWSAWSEGTPKQRMLVDAIHQYPGHLLCSMRSKTEWTTEVGTNGRSAPKRVGLAPEQGKNIEYEFDLLMELSEEHTGRVIKDRSGKFQDRIVTKPDEEFGRELAAWLSDGAPYVPPAPVIDWKSRAAELVKTLPEDKKPRAREMWAANQHEELCHWIAGGAQ